MRYTAFTALVVTATYLICWGHWRSVDAAHLPIVAPSSGSGADQQRNPWMFHRTSPETQNNFTDDPKPHMCIPEHKYAGLSAAIHRLEEELKIVTNLTFINAGNHTIPTTTYEGFTQQLSLIKDILKNIDDENRPNSNPMPNFRHINFTDLLPLLPKWEHAVIENATNFSKNVSSDTFGQVFDYNQRYHHQSNIFLHMLIEFLLNLQENFENLLDYVEQYSHTNPTIRQKEPISDEKLEQMELRFEHFASSILQKISELEGKLQLADERNNKISPAEKHEDTVIKPQSVASPVWKDHVTHNTSLSGIEDKLDVLHEKFINFAKDTEERLEALEARHGTSGPPSITASTCDSSQRHLLGSSCYGVPRILNPSIPGAGPPTARLYTWWDARYLCKDMMGPRADLATVRSEPQMKELTKMLHNHFGAIEEFWLGASDLDTEGQWTWVDGQPLGPYNNWASQPQMSTDQNCLSMLRGYMWADEPCFYERNALCELRLE